ncbi:MAG: hypothetical protein ABS81_24515 [Pseudonocardia sp. SCN 72-86]|nr:MAG: hypothetical protein ABS81_24515 [Pseudonocardia sp. SCN 72-86]
MPRSGCGQRISASELRTVPSAATTGWYSSTSRSSAIAARSSASTLLGLLHGDLGEAQHVGGPQARVGRRRRQPDRGGDLDGAAGDRHRRPQQLRDGAPQPFRATRLGVVGTDDDELVAREPGRGAAERQLSLQPAGQGDEQVVAGLVAQRGVDAGEVVEVAADEDHTVAGGAEQEPVDHLERGGPVEQPGQRVDRAGAAQHLGGAAAVVDVLAGDEEQRGAVVGAGDGDADPAPDARAVGAQQRQRVDPVAVLGALGDAAQPVGQAVGRQRLRLGRQRGRGDTAQVLRRGVEDRAHRGVGVEDATGGVEQQDTGGQQRDEVGEAGARGAVPVLGDALRRQVADRADEPHRGPVLGALDDGAAAQQPAAGQAQVDVVVTRAVAVAQPLAQQRDLLALDGAVGTVGGDPRGAVQVVEGLAAAQRGRGELVGPGADPGHPLQLRDAPRVRRRPQLHEHDRLQVHREVPADHADTRERAVGADEPGVAVGADDETAQRHPDRAVVGVAGHAAGEPGERGVDPHDPVGPVDHHGGGRRQRQHVGPRAAERGLADARRHERADRCVGRERPRSLASGVDGAGRERRGAERPVAARVGDRLGHGRGGCDGGDRDVAVLVVDVVVGVAGCPVDRPCEVLREAHRIGVGRAARGLPRPAEIGHGDGLGGRDLVPALVPLVTGTTSELAHGLPPPSAPTVLPEQRGTRPLDAPTSHGRTTPPRVRDRKNTHRL